MHQNKFCMIMHYNHKFVLFLTDNVEQVIRIPNLPMVQRGDTMAQEGSPK